MVKQLSIRAVDYPRLNAKEQNLLLKRSKDFFRNEIVEAHINTAFKKARKLSNYNINPFLFKYLANFLKGNDNPGSIAEAPCFRSIDYNFIWNEDSEIDKRIV